MKNYKEHLDEYYVLRSGDLWPEKASIAFEGEEVDNCFLKYLDENGMLFKNLSEAKNERRFFYMKKREDGMIKRFLWLCLVVFGLDIIARLILAFSGNQ